MNKPLQEMAHHKGSTWGAITIRLGWTLGWWALALGLALAHSVRAETLSLNEYLGQVVEKSSAVKASNAAVEAAKLQEERGALAFSPYLSGELKHVYDHSPTVSPAFQGDKTVTDVWNVGAGMQTRFGLTGQVSYGTTRTDISGALPTLLPEPTFNTAVLKFDFKQSLLKNGFGQAWRAQEEAAAASARAQGAQAGYQLDTLKAQAEAAYWSLAVQREQVGLARESLARAKRIRDWNAKKASLNLVDRSNLLQAEAALKLAELNLRNAQDDERTAARNFNKLREASSNEVPETLAPYVSGIQAAMDFNVPAGVERGDVAGARELEKAAAANEISAAQDLKPQLDAAASMALNGRDPNFGTSVGNSFSTKNPSVTVGLSLRVPLDFSLNSRLRQSYALQTKNAQFNARQNSFASDQALFQLSTQLDDLRSKLELVNQVVKLQGEKFRNEQQRHERGRTTTAQLLQFEQDLANAQLSKLALEGQVLQLYAQLKVFRQPSAKQDQ